MPTVVAVDSRCAYKLPRGDISSAVSVEHGATVPMPDGRQVAMGPISFASPADPPYFAMSLPSVWRAAGVTSTLGLERLMDGVLLHEMSHTRQTALATMALDPIARANDLGADLNDDIVQQTFGKDPAYAAAYAIERDRLFAAAAARDPRQARRLAGEALRMMRERRARWFIGRRAYLGDLDDVFLTMEGLGQWLAYAWYVSRRGGSIAPSRALAGVRRAGDQWSQDEGLALFLVIDRLLPDWQRRAFREPDWRASRLLASAVGEQ